MVVDVRLPGFWLGWVLVCIVATATAAAPRRDGAMTIPAVPKGHPRVYVRPDDLPGIRAKLSDPAFASAWSIVQDAARRAPAEGGGAFCSAFVYLATGDKAQGRKAIDGTLAVLATSDDARTFRMPFHWAACVYDWCYDLLSAAERQAFVAQFKRIASLHRPYYPAEAERCNAVVGHDTEGWLLTGQLPAGVAIHDESPEMYDAAARVFFDTFVEVRDYYYPSHTHHQGHSYATRLIYDQAASWLFRRMGAGDVLSREQQFVPYNWIYNLRPDGQQIRRGDSFDSARSGRRKGNMMMTGSYYADDVVLGMADGPWFDDMLKPYHEVFELLLRPAGVKTKPMTGLPLTKYFAEPMGEMVARTGWTMGHDSRDAVVFMRVGGTFFGNHQIRDMGTFQVYYRGGLAISSGVYQGIDTHYGTAHWKDYYHQTLAHNGLLVFDPNEPLAGVRKVNDGGQRVPNEGRDHPRDLPTLLNDGYVMGKVTAHAFGPDAMQPEYSYLAGDITDGYTNKVRRVTRSMVTLTLRDARYPCVLVVFDRVTAAKPEFKKTWLLHTINEPQVDGDTITVVRTEGPYDGKLEVRSLLPATREVRVIGGPGKAFWVESTKTNYAVTPSSPEAEPGAWRVEISPAEPSQTDHFLHVLTPMDAGVAEGPPIAALATETEDVVGVAVLDRAVVFGLKPEPATQRSFTLGPGPTRRVLVCDLAPGQWRITRDGQPIGEQVTVTAPGKSLYVEGGVGHYQLVRVNDSVPAEPKKSFWRSLAEESLRTRAGVGSRDLD